MLYAAFIGIDKHLDQDIPDLTGARRDATALWTLFSDTLPDINATLLTDAEATVDRIRSILDGTLGVAGDGDTVILSFAGHGTHDHRLVAYDTSKSALADTTIPMAELATRFKESRAKAVLCILDCCFSGGAPARVLEDSALPRDPGISLDTLAGKGRLLIAAANIKEVAYELPGSGHGILTKALLDVLQSSEDFVHLPRAMDQVMERVRAEAARIGVVQTPVLFGYVEGGLTLPALRPGARFFQAFPEVRGVRVSQVIEELAAFRFPKEILAAWASRFTEGLNEIQLQAVNEYRVLDGESLLVVAPTSSGKTFIGEMAALRAIIDGRKAVFLLPYKALVNEKYDQFSHLYGEQLGVRVIRCTGDRLDHVGPFVRGKYDVALLTYEMFLSLVVSNPALLHQIGLVVLDEAQFITDPVRGINVELLLTYLLAARERGIAPQLVALSAVIGNINSFDQWLGCKMLITNVRPIPLIEGVLDRSGVWQFVDVSSQVRLEQLLPPGAIRQRKEKPSSQDVIVPLVQTLLRENQNERIIVFRNKRGSAEGCAAYLADELGLAAARDALAALPGYDLSRSSATLRRCLSGGTAFHNTNLVPEEKEVVERVFRDPAGGVKVLAATTTVAAGINTPASTVVLAEQQFVGEDGRPFTVAEYKNMAGRAGRLGFNEKGRAIILANNSYERETLFERYVMGQLEPLRSSFDPEHIETWILRLLAQVKRVPRADVPRLLANTYGGYIAIREQPGWQEETAKRLDALLGEMIRLDLVEQEVGDVQLTLLGQVCGRSSLSFPSLMCLIDLLKRVQSDITALQLMALIQGLPELDRVYTPVMKTSSKAGKKVVQSETRWPRDAAQRYGHGVVTALQRSVSDFFGYYARCKRGLILWDWVQGVALEGIEQNYSVNMYNAVGYGDVQSIASTTRFHLRAAHQIATVILIDKGPSEESIESLLKQLEVGIPEDALDLLSIPLPLTRGEYLALHGARIRTPEDLWNCSVESLQTIVGPVRAAQLERLRPTGSLVATEKEGF